MIDKTRLAEKCSTWNIALTGAQLDMLDRYAALLVDYNQKVNLTAITTPEGIEDRHFADSLLFAAQPEVQGALVDVGTGAGFPGIVAKIFKPDLQLTLMEPTGKRVEFLRYVCGELGLSGVEFVKERAEEAARKVWRERFTVAGDAPHYLYLAEHFYATAGEKINLIVFYPLYPFLVGLLGDPPPTRTGGAL